MKLAKKDIIYILLAAVMFSVTGIVAFTQLAPKGAATGSAQATVEIVDPLVATLNTDALNTLGDPNKVRDYFVPIDLSTGLGNKAPFGPY